MIVQRVYDVSRRHNYPEFKDVCETIQAYYGGGGLNTPVVVETLVFDEGQITSPTNGNHPTWGGVATLSPHGTPTERQS